MVTVVGPEAPTGLNVTVTTLFGTRPKGAGETRRTKGVATVPPPPPPLVEPPPPHEVNEPQARSVIVSNASACSGIRQALLLKGQERKVRVMRKKSQLLCFWGFDCTLECLAEQAFTLLRSLVPRRQGALLLKLIRLATLAIRAGLQPEGNDRQLSASTAPEANLFQKM